VEAGGITGAARYRVNKIRRRLGEPDECCRKTPDLTESSRARPASNIVILLGAGGGRAADNVADSQCGSKLRTNGMVRLPSPGDYRVSYWDRLI
jgi:hypothetical protein